MGKLKEFWITYFGGLYLSHHAVGLDLKKLGKDKTLCLGPVHDKNVSENIQLFQSCSFLSLKGFQCYNVFCRAFSKLHHKNVSNKSIWERVYLRTFSCGRLTIFFISERFLVFNVITFSVEPFPNDNIKIR